jgi:hypothetical protein
MADVNQTGQAEHVTTHELAELRRKAAVADWLFSNSTVELGWHGNPENHTLNVALFFGSFDPQHLVRPNAHGHATLELKDIEEVIEHEKQKPEFRRKSRKQLSQTGRQS